MSGALRPACAAPPASRKRYALLVSHAGAQCAHAAVGVTARYSAKFAALFRQWEACGQPKIALKVSNEQEMVRGGGGCSTRDEWDCLVRAGKMAWAGLTACWQGAKGPS